MRKSEIDWRIGLEGRAWDGPSGEAIERYMLLQEMKLELIDGKLMCNDEARLLLAGLLLENLGAAAVVQIGDPEVWRAAVSRLR